MVRIGIDHHLVLAPNPVAAEAKVKGCDTEIIPPKPETVRPPTRQHPDVLAAKAAVEASMLPRMIEVVVDVSTAGIMSDPFAVGVNVRSVRMPFRVPEVTGLGRGRLWLSRPSWTVRRYIGFSLLALPLFFALCFRPLRKCRD
jgi:hypothetical protein